MSVVDACTDEMVQRFFNAVHTGELKIAGCRYKLLHLPTRKSNSAEKKAQCHDIVLFLESGIGFDTIHVADVQEWHQPTNQWPQKHSMYKYLKYQQNGFSNAHPTVQLAPEDLVEMPDTLAPETGKLMSDGCAPISETWMRRILENYSPEKKTFSKRRSGLPSVFQGRIGNLYITYST